MAGFAGYFNNGHHGYPGVDWTLCYQLSGSISLEKVIVSSTLRPLSPLAPKVAVVEGCIS